jgi:ABC-type cobalamin/Fe3+-siderophores transport system ATPase subunit
MVIEVTFIAGPSNSGKSTLVRTLAGKGQDGNTHANPLNIATLNWGGKDEKTFVMHSSLNERTFIQPGNLGNILDLYMAQGISKAILCLSTTPKKPHAQLYADLFHPGGQMTQRANQHILKDIVLLKDRAGSLGSVVSWPIATHPPQNYQTRNLVGRNVRPLLKL